MSFIETRGCRGVHAALTRASAAHVAGAVFLAICIAACATSTDPESGLSADERRRAREIPPTGSAVASFRGVEHVGELALAVTGDHVEFMLTARDPNTGALLTSHPQVPDHRTLRSAEGISFEASAAAPDYVASGGYYNPATGEDQKLLVERLRIRADRDALMMAELDVRVGYVAASDGTWSEVEGAQLERITVRGHMTSSCRVIVHGSTVLLDPERTANPLCRELLEGL